MGYCLVGECLFGDDTLQLRGNLHSHSRYSDGSLPARELVLEYASRGYGFLCISDHDILGPTPESPSGMVILPGWEVSAGGPHVLAVGCSDVVLPDPDRQVVIRQIAAQGGLAVLNHPNWEGDYDHFPQHEMVALNGYAGIEVYNGVVEFLEGSATAFDRWDQLLTLGRSVLSFAHDDTHWPGNIGLGWNVVVGSEPTAESILAALKSGRFYCSTGVVIDSVGTQDGGLTVRSALSGRIRFIGSHGRLLAQSSGPEASYQVDASTGPYVRAECYGTAGAMAWTQAFRVAATP